MSKHNHCEVNAAEKERREKISKTLTASYADMCIKKCMCGCKTLTKTVFVPGHNKRFSKLLTKVANRPEVRKQKSKSQRHTLKKRKKNNPKEHKRWLKHLRRAMKKRFNRPGIREWYSQMMADKWNDPDFVEAYNEAAPLRLKGLKESWEKSSPEEKADRASKCARGAAAKPNKQECYLNKFL